MLEVDDGRRIEVGLSSQVADRDFEILAQLTQLGAVAGESLATRHPAVSTRDADGWPGLGLLGPKQRPTRAIRGPNDVGVERQQ